MKPRLTNNTPGTPHIPGLQDQGDQKLCPSPGSQTTHDKTFYQTPGGKAGIDNHT